MYTKSLSMQSFALFSTVIYIDFLPLLSFASFQPYPLYRFQEIGGALENALRLSPAQGIGC